MNKTERILDANINRAAEGMRVLEDIARFVLENETLCGSIKECRHLLRHCVPSQIHARDTTNDVGTGISTNTESTRKNIHAIAIASGNRCAEALRVIEEFIKLTGDGGKVETIRYRMYDLSAEVVKILGQIHASQWKLCFVMTASECVLPWKNTLMQVVDAGCDCVQLREKNMTTRELIAHTTEVMTLVKDKNVAVIVNDRIDVALTCNATGVHLGKEDMPVKQARKLVGTEALIGATAHSVEAANQAIEDGANYVGVGAMFASPTKPSVDVANTELLQHVLKYDHLAIGGINADNAHELYAAGCRGIAVSSAIAQSIRPGETASALLQKETQLA